MGIVNKYEPTFPPTRIDYDCYPWRNNPTDQDQDNQDKNALSYLMMSDFKSPPSKTLAYTGQYVDDSHDATYVMNRSLFWPWMMSKLRQVVIGIVPVPDYPILEWDDSDKDHPYLSDLSYHFGDNNATSNDYVFTALTPGKWSWQGRPLSSTKTVTNPHDSSDSETINQYTNVDFGIIHLSKLHEI